MASPLSGTALVFHNSLSQAVLSAASALPYLSQLKARCLSRLAWREAETGLLSEALSGFLIEDPV